MCLILYFILSSRNNVWLKGQLILRPVSLKPPSFHGQYSWKKSSIHSSKQKFSLKLTTPCKISWFACRINLITSSFLMPFVYWYKELFVICCWRYVVSNGTYGLSSNQFIHTWFFVRKNERKRTNKIEQIDRWKKKILHPQRLHSCVELI